MPKENGPLAAALCMIGTAATAANLNVDNLATWLDGRCAGGGFYCGWCAAGQTPPGNCIKGYAGCVYNAYIASDGDMLYDDKGNILTRTEDNLITQYKCTSNGWEKIETQISSGGGDSDPRPCDRYSYYDADLNLCLTCPNTGIFYEASLDPYTELLARGDNYEFLLRGCNYYYNQGETYYDKTGAFTFVESGQCFHDGRI